MRRFILICFFQVLVLERPSKSTFSGAIVFPGGVTERVDEVDAWLTFFKKFGVDDAKFKSIIRTHPNRSFIFQQESSESINK